MIPLLRYLLGAGLILALHAGAEEPLRRYLYAATPDGAQFETGSGEGLLVSNWFGESGACRSKPAPAG